VIVIGTFPFGRPIETLTQQDRSPKRVFILGVYPSAVYARWLDEEGTTLLGAVAVASEPEIAWRGEGLDEIVASIPVPAGAGSLVPAGDNMNGPSGAAVDELFLGPLGLTRSDAWMCDLVPYSCKNNRQATALKRAYDKRATKLGLPAYDWPSVPEQLADDARRAEIADEIAQAAPDMIITLGDQPLRWFANYYGSKSKLSAYGETRDEYGRFGEVRIGKRTMALLPLAHPRQVARLGSHSATLAALHEHWIRHVAPELLLDTPAP
jgi:uracil-DNA glycosylase